jgi:hypothetical protein
MANDNRISVTITDQQVADIVTHIAALETALPFLLNREPDDISVLLGEKSVGFDEKCGAYMNSNPDYIPSYIDTQEVNKDRAARAQFLKFLPRLRLLVDKANDTFDIIGNELMLADLAYYSNTGDAAKRGRSDAQTIHDDLATRYPGRPGKAKTAFKP